MHNMLSKKYCDITYRVITEMQVGEKLLPGGPMLWNCIEISSLLSAIDSVIYCTADKYNWYWKSSFRCVVVNTTTYSNSNIWWTIYTLFSVAFTGTSSSTVEIQSQNCYCNVIFTACQTSRRKAIEYISSDYFDVSPTELLFTKTK
jgi:hypothetical protein